MTVGQSSSRWLVNRMNASTWYGAVVVNPHVQMIKVSSSQIRTIGSHRSVRTLHLHAAQKPVCDEDEDRVFG